MSPPDEGARPFPFPSPFPLATGAGAAFPPTPSRTTSKLSITSADAHLSPPSGHAQLPVTPSAGPSKEQRKRAHSTPRPGGLKGSTSTRSLGRAVKSSELSQGHGYHSGSGNGSNSRTPTKATSLKGKTSASSGAGLLNAHPASPALRARASTASSRVSMHDAQSLENEASIPSGSGGLPPSSSTSSGTMDIMRLRLEDDAKGGSSGDHTPTTASISAPSSASTSLRKGKGRASGHESESRGGSGGEAETETGTDLTSADVAPELRLDDDAQDVVAIPYEDEGGVVDVEGEGEGEMEGEPELGGGQDSGVGDDELENGVRIQDTSGSSSSVDVKPTHCRHYSPRKYYVLTHAGKPVFCSHDDDSDGITNLMGIAQALISIFAEDDDKIRCIVKGSHRIAFLLKTPLYLFCVSDWGEPEHVLRSHLDYIHLHILSVVSSTQLSRVFQRRSNFDLSRLLDGTETFLNKLIDRAQYDFSYLTCSLQPLRMNPALRDTAAAALMPPSKFKDLLYVLLIAGGHIVTLLRPRKHSIHPSDLHLLLNTLASSATLRSSETWLPVCFPKFNPAGFVHAYISYLLDDVGLVFVSADREAFGELRGWKEIVLEKLEHDKTLSKIKDAIPSHPYIVSTVGCPGLRHFIYKSRTHVQITQPEWESPYTEGTDDQKRLITLYQKLHDAVHARSGQSAPLKLVYMKTEHEACLAWFTKPFELYLTVSPQLSKSAVVAAANAVAKWVLSEEGRVFLKDAPVF